MDTGHRRAAAPFTNAPIALLVARDGTLGPGLRRGDRTLLNRADIEGLVAPGS